MAANTTTNQVKANSNLVEHFHDANYMNDNFAQTLSDVLVRNKKMSTWILRSSPIMTFYK